MKIITLVGTRPEIIRLSETIKLLDLNFDHTFIHSGQNMAANMKDVFFQDLDLRLPDIQWTVDPSSLAKTIGSTMERLENYILESKPDALLTLGDTNTAIAGLIAKRMGVITYHLEAGNRSFDENVPEETNRRSIDHFSDFNLAYSDRAYENLMREGLSPRRTIKCGSPMREVINANLSKVHSSTVLSKLGLNEGEYFLVSLHRQENVNSSRRLASAINSINSLAHEYKMPVLFSVHPRTGDRIRRSGIEISKAITLHEPLGYIDFLKLQLNSFCVLSDSGTVSEESAILGFPAITIRDSMERPEALDTGSIMMVGLDFDSIQRGIKLATSPNNILVSPRDYESTNHSQVVVKFIHSTLGRANEWLGVRNQDS